MMLLAVRCLKGNTPNMARLAALMADLPVQVGGVTVNRFYVWFASNQHGR